MSANKDLLLAFEVLVNGSTIDRAKGDSLLDAIVEQSSELPDACTLRFRVSIFQKDGEQLLGENVFPEGAVVKVRLRDLGSEMATLFEGEIVGVELDLTSVGPSTLTVRA